MENQTSVNYFHILPFPNYINSKTLISISLFLLYSVALLINSFIITVISLEPQLHHPMYLFICNLSFVDILYTTVTVPKFLYILLSGNNIVSFAQCYTQFYFYIVAASAEEILLFIMAYDRYVAICLPLYYHRILSNRNCALMTMGFWVTSWLNSLLFTYSVLMMTVCHSNTIHQFFCDIKYMTRISCTSSGQFYVVLVLELLLFGVGPISCTIISYINIFSVILCIKTSEGRRKAFSTCSSHLSVITLYYTSAVLVFILPVYSKVMDFVFTTFYTTGIPILNPIMYSLQNSGVKKAFHKIIERKINHVSCYIPHCNVTITNIKEIKHL